MAEEVLHLKVATSGSRLDKFIAENSPLTRSQAQRLIREGRVTINGEPAKASQSLKGGENIALTRPEPAPLRPEAEPLPLHIIYEDSELMVIDKPPGLTVHPGPGHASHTLVNALLAHCPDLPGADTLRPGLVHRLDKDTSGLLIVAKTEAARIGLTQQMKQRSIIKGYLALVKGKLTPEQGSIEAPIGRHPYHRKRMAVVPSGRPARTSYRAVRYLEDYTLVEATLETGRTHQLRVHFSSLGFPVVGDATYGVKSPNLKRQFLHASYLRFRHPKSGDWLEFTSPLPPDLAQALAELS